MSIAIFCNSANEFQAETIVIELRNTGFSDSDISVLFTDKSRNNDVGPEQRNKAPQGAFIGVVALGPVGGAFGLLAGMGVVAKTGLNSLVTAGPAVATLAGIVVGVVAGAIIGAWIGMGIPGYVIKRPDSKTESGNILISVHADEMAKAKLAKSIFSEAGAQDIVMTGEAEVPATRVLSKHAETHAVA
jgi:hypothetical protein